jgi:hypothetical protein
MTELVESANSQFLDRSLVVDWMGGLDGPWFVWFLSLSDLFFFAFLLALFFPLELMNRRYD